MEPLTKLTSENEKHFDQGRIDAGDYVIAVALLAIAERMEASNNLLTRLTECFRPAFGQPKKNKPVTQAALTLDNPALLTLKEVGAELNISPTRAAQLVRAKLLKGVRLGRQIRVSREQLNAFLERGGKALPGGWRKNPPGATPPAATPAFTGPTSPVLRCARTIDCGPHFKAGPHVCKRCGQSVVLEGVQAQAFIANNPGIDILCTTCV